MAPRKTVSWSELRVGLLVMTVAVILGLFVFYGTREAVFAAKARYHTFLPDAAGLKKGAPVRLAGLEVGTVEDIRLAKVGAERTRQTEIGFHIRSEFQDYLRTDSLAYITTEGLLGESVLEIDPGVAGDKLALGAEVPGTQKGNIKQVVQNVEHITRDVRVMMADVRAGKGTLGKLFVDQGLYDRAELAVRQFQSLTAKAAAGEGTLGRLMVKEDLYNQLKGTADTLDQVARDLREGKGTLGKLIYDTTVYDQAQNVTQRLDKITAKIESGEGSIGKAIYRDELHDNMNQTFANAREITRKLNEGEGSFGRAVNDPKLYDNVTGWTGEMRELIRDFRANPKKYLRIKMSIF
ncbi:MAG TPA: MlaD family protein [Candidatus Xenobia bacterium]|nr:MlaD family protein [Candidatus Xenobia bacterium]